MKYRAFWNDAFGNQHVSLFTANRPTRQQVRKIIGLKKGERLVSWEAVR